MVTLAVVGAKNSGKTVVIEFLIRHLTEKGYRVATVKHTSHHHRFDTPGKDSYRHRAAGAGLTITRSREETAVFSRPELLGVDQLQNLTAGLFDIWLVEGDHRSGRPTVLVTRLLEQFPGELPANIVATIGPRRISKTSAHFESGDTAGLAEFVIETLLGRRDTSG
jgi:molybdopterin-guanine dinucleotide biosynthesis protein B